MHDGMPYDPIQGQGQGHGASEVPKIALFYVYLKLVSWSLTSLFSTNMAISDVYLNLCLSTSVHGS